MKHPRENALVFWVTISTAAANAASSLAAITSAGIQAGPRILENQIDALPSFACELALEIVMAMIAARIQNHESAG